MVHRSRKRSGDDLGGDAARDAGPRIERPGGNRKSERNRPALEWCANYTAEEWRTRKEALEKLRGASEREFTVEVRNGKEMSVRLEGEFVGDISPEETPENASKYKTVVKPDGGAIRSVSLQAAPSHEFCLPVPKRSCSKPMVPSSARRESVGSRSLAFLYSRFGEGLLPLRLDRSWETGNAPYRRSRRRGPAYR